MISMIRKASGATAKKGVPRRITSGCSRPWQKGHSKVIEIDHDGATVTFIASRHTLSGDHGNPADKEGIADTRPPSTAQEPVEASSRPVPRAGPKPRPRPRPPSAPAARLHHAYDPRASAHAHGGLGWPWAQARPGLGSAWVPLGPSGPQNNPRTTTKQLPEQQEKHLFFCCSAAHGGFQEEVSKALPPLSKT